MTVAQEAARLLETAAGFIELGWTQNSNARLADGTPCSPEQPDAACWCAQGAISAAQHELGINTTRDGVIDGNVPASVYPARLLILDKARKGLREAIEEGAHPDSLSAVSITLCITNWNDDAAVGGEQVARTLRRGAAILRQSAPVSMAKRGLGGFV